MESTYRLHPRSGRAAHLALEDLRQRAWEALLDLGLTEDEIASYFGSDLDALKTLAAFGDNPGAGRTAS